MQTRSIARSRRPGRRRSPPKRWTPPRTPPAFCSRKVSPHPCRRPAPARDLGPVVEQVDYTNSEHPWRGAHHALQYRGTAEVLPGLHGGRWPPRSSPILDVGVTPDQSAADSNFFEKWYPVAGADHCDQHRGRVPPRVSASLACVLSRRRALPPLRRPPFRHRLLDGRDRACRRPPHDSAASSPSSSASPSGSSSPRPTAGIPWSCTPTSRSSTGFPSTTTNAPCGRLGKEALGRDREPQSPRRGSRGAVPLRRSPDNHQYPALRVALEHHSAWILLSVGRIDRTRQSIRSFKSATARDSWAQDRLSSRTRELVEQARIDERPLAGLIARLCSVDGVDVEFDLLHRCPVGDVEEDLQGIDAFTNLVIAGDPWSLVNEASLTAIWRPPAVARPEYSYW